MARRGPQDRAPERPGQRGRDVRLDPGRRRPRRGRHHPGAAPAAPAPALPGRLEAPLRENPALVRHVGPLIASPGLVSMRCCRDLPRRRAPRSRAPSVTYGQRLAPRRCDIAVASSRSETSRMLRAASAAPPLCGSTGYSPARTMATSMSHRRGMTGCEAGTGVLAVPGGAGEAGGGARSRLALGRADGGVDLGLAGGELGGVL